MSVRTFTRRFVALTGLSALVVSPARAETDTLCTIDGHVGEWGVVSGLRYPNDKGRLMDRYGACSVDSIRVDYGPVPGSQVGTRSVTFILPKAARPVPKATYAFDIAGAGLHLTGRAVLSDGSGLILDGDNALLMEAALMANLDEVHLRVRLDSSDQVIPMLFRFPQGYSRARRRLYSDLDKLDREFQRQACVIDDAGCFITTACLWTLNLPDKGWELRTLRRFRDNKLRRMHDGEEAIAYYYRLAPEVNRWLLAQPDAAARYATLYRRYIFPAACLASLGLDRFTRRVYTAMIRRLMRDAPFDASAHDGLPPVDPKRLFRLLG